MSSNPQAHQAVSEKPGALDVSETYNKDEKDRDVERKLKVYEAVKAFQAGHLPSNAQVDSFLVRALEHHFVQRDKLSPASRQVEEDFNDVLETLRTIIKTKNPDELIQHFMFDSKGPKLDPTAHDAPVDQKQAKEDAENAAQHLRTLVMLFLTNAEMRKVFFDLGTFGRDVIATSAVKAAEKIRPTDEQLREAEREAPKDERVASGGERHGTASKPELSDTNAGEVITQAKEGQAHVEGIKSSAFLEAEEGTQAVREGQVAHVTAKKGEQAKQIKEELASPGGQERTKRTLKERYQNFRDKFGPTEDESDKLRLQRERAAQFFDETFPQDRRQQIYHRLKKAVIECQTHDEYDEAVTAILDLLETYQGHAGQLKTKGLTSASEISADPGFLKSWENLKIILARISGRSLDGVIESINQLYSDAKADEGLRKWWREVDGYVRKSLLEPGYIVEDECGRDGHALIDRGRQFFDDKYASRMDKLLDEVSVFLKGFSEDPLNARLGTDIQRLAKDLLFNEDGSLVFKSEIFEDFRREILPALISQVGFIPVPRIEYQDKQVDLVIENLVLQGATLFPSFIDVETTYHTRFSPTKPSAVGAGKSGGRMTVRLEQIQADIRDVNIAFRKKTGFPKIKDSGMADVLIGGQGIGVTVILETAPPNSQALFVVHSVKAHVGTLKVAIRHSSHDMTYKLLLPLVTGLIKKNIAHSIENAVRTGLEYVQTQLHSVRQQVKEAGEKPGASKGDAFSKLLQKTKVEGEETKAEVEGKTSEVQGRVTVGEPPQVKQSTEKVGGSSNDAGWKSNAFDFL